MIENSPLIETAVLVGLTLPKIRTKVRQRNIWRNSNFWQTLLVPWVKKHFLQRLDIPNHATFVGTGKLEEIGEYIKANEIGAVIFDDDLSPTQLRNIEKALECKVLDRTFLILDIFARRAQTAHAKTQVELAQYTIHAAETDSLMDSPWSVSAGVSGCADLVNRKLKPTAVLFSIKSCLAERADDQDRQAKNRHSVKPVDVWFVWLWLDTPM